MIVVCAFMSDAPNEVKLAVGGGAGTVQVVTAARLMREESEKLLMGGDLTPYGRGETGEVGPFEDVGPDDVLITVSWVDGEPAWLDYRYTRGATPDQLLTAAIALDEYVRFGVWSSRYLSEFQSQLDRMVDQRVRAAYERQAGERAAAEIVRANRLPPDATRLGRS